MIFRVDAGDLLYKGRVNEAGRTLDEFRFRVSLEKSHYSFFNRKERTMIAYQGTFLVDPKKADLVRLVVTGQPWESGTCEITTTMDYARVRLNRSDFLLPTQADLKIVDTNGDEFHNQTVYSSCHEFLGESTLTFEPPPEPSETETARSGLEWRCYRISRPAFLSRLRLLKTLKAGWLPPAVNHCPAGHRHP